MGYSLTTPPTVERYFGGAAYIVQDFHPDRGWQDYRMWKLISPSRARKLRREGVTGVALVPVAAPERAPADFTITELLRGNT